MAEVNIIPTRMELRKIKTKLKTAEKGYKLLKDKTNELIRKFYSVIKENKQMRMSLKGELISVMNQFKNAKLFIDEIRLNQLFLMPTLSLNINFEKQNLLNCEIPCINMQEERINQPFAYSPIDTTSEMDKCLSKFYDLLPKIIKLAEIEKTTYLMADEIEKNKRRVNALENIVLPKYKTSINKIEMKLAENDRSTTSRLMKVKSMVKN